MSIASRPSWQRPDLPRRGPDRRAGNFYRTAEGSADRNGERGGGIPLGSAEDVVAAAVRLAYDVASAQIARSDQLAKRLRAAGDRATGGDSTTSAVNAADRLMTKAILSGLEWWETSVAQGRCPTTRLFAAEYRLLGTMLGFDAKTATVPPAPDIRGTGSAAAEAAVAVMSAVVIVHLDEPAERRPITIERFVLACPVAAAVYFFHRTQPDLDSWPAQIDHGLDGRARLLLATATRAAGNWRAVICDVAGVQLGMVEIAL